jgi:hypothetical protein
VFVHEAVTAFVKTAAESVALGNTPPDQLVPSAQFPLTFV